MVLYRSVIGALLLTLALCVTAHAADVEVTPPIAFSASYSTSTPIDLRGTGVILHKITWATSGTVSAGACLVQSSLDNTFASPTTIIAAQTVTSGGGPTRWVTANANFVRITCASPGTPITGSGSVRITYDGVNPKPITDINGAAVTATSDPCFGSLTTPTNGIVASTTLVKVVTAASGKKNYGCGILVVNDGAAAAHFSLIEGTTSSTPCDTAAVALIGSTTAASGMPAAANQGGWTTDKTIAGQTANSDWCIQNDGTNSIKVWFPLIQQ